MKSQKSNNEIYKTFYEYEPNESIFSEDSQEMYRIKKAISELDHYDRNIILLYAETGSQYDTAKRLGLSVSTLNRKIFQIRYKISEMIYKNHTFYNKTKLNSNENDTN